LRHIPNVQRNQYGTPLLSDLFEKAHALASNNTLCYVNADIMLLGDFMGSVQQVASWRDRFLMVGRRTNIDLDQPAIYGSPDQEARLQALVLQQNRLGSPTAIDYFVFPRGPFRTLPPFAIGRPRWDNWVLWKARQVRMPLVDGSARVLAVHQNHDYSHLPQGRQNAWQGEEAKQNINLARRGFSTIEDATHKLTVDGIKPNFRPFLSSKKQVVKTWWWEFLRVTGPVRFPLGLGKERIARLLGRARLPSS